MKKRVIFYKILVFVSLVLISINAFLESPLQDKVTNIYGADEKGIYISDPVSWIKNGHNVLLHDLKFAIRAQVFDQHGFTMDSVVKYEVPTIRKEGTMYMFNPRYNCKKASIKRSRITESIDYSVTLRSENVNTTIVAHSAPARCDNLGCHQMIPPKHILEKQSTDGEKSRCNNCHDLALKIHPLHYQKIPDSADSCEKCHPNSGCLVGIHTQSTYNPHTMTCSDVHGTLYDSIKGSFRISKQARLPRCDNCHDKEYIYSSGDSFKDSYGHGGVACINCHASTHLGNHTSLGYNACARACHTTQPNDSTMGADCSKCHATSVAPHHVKRTTVLLTDELGSAEGTP